MSSSDKTKSFLNTLLNIKSIIDDIGLDMREELDEMFDCIIEYNTLSIQNEILDRRCKFYEDGYIKKIINERFGFIK